MDVQEIDIFIDKDGQVHLEVRGVKGLGCLDLTKALETALGGDVTFREMRPEAYELAEQTQSEQQRNKF